MKGDLAKPLVKHITGFVDEIDYCFYRSLCLLALYPLRSASDQELYMEEVKENLVMLNNHALACPGNFVHRKTLVDSEICRVQGSPMLSTLEKYMLAVE
jgi:hypothetical protein